MALGYHATAIAKPVLMEINRQIEEIKEERSRRYEQRTISEDGIYDRSRRNAVSESPDIGRREVRQEGDRPVRKPVEGVHEGETSTETVRTDSHGMINEMICKVDEEAEQKKEALIQQLLNLQPMPETEDTLARAGHMELITRQAEEIILEEVIYQVR